MKKAIETLGLSALLLAPAIMSSCLRDDPPELRSTDLTVNFTFDSPTRTGDSFLDAIDNVTVFLFDEDQCFVTSNSVSRAELQRFQGTTFSVVPGTYNVMGWANISSVNSEFSDMTTLRTLSDSFIEIGNRSTGDPIYYAPGKTPGDIDDPITDYSMYVTEVVCGADNRKTIEFADVHRHVTVLVRGYENTEWYDGNPPVIEACDAGAKYDFLLRADLTPVNLSQSGVPFTGSDGGTMYSAEFYSALIPLSDRMGICLYNTTTHSQDSGSMITTILLDDFMKANNLTDDLDLVITLNFTEDNRIEITLPLWGDSPVIN